MDNKQKQDWISNKIEILIREGYDRDQAYAIAKSMAEGRKHQADYGPVNFGTYGNNNPTEAFGPQNERYIPSSTYSTFQNFYQPQPQTQTQQQFGMSTWDIPENTQQRVPVQSVNSITPQPSTVPTPTPQATLLTEENIRQVQTPTAGTEENTYDAKTEEKIGIYNPYAGVDIPTASVYFGQSLENNDTMGAIGSGLKLGLGIARNVFSGIGIQRRNNELEREAREEQREQNTRARPMETGGTMNLFPFTRPIDRYQEGGEKEVSSAKIRTGEYLTGVSENNTTVEPNAEIETEEYLLTPDGQSAKVIGKTHEQGGEEVELKDGDMIISDHLKVGGETAKMLRNEYDIKLKAKNTYADAVDKIYSKIGLTKLIKEEEKLLEKIEKQEEDTKDETTKNLNLEFLYKQRDKILQEKQNLEPERLGALKQIFALQENSKPEQEVKEEFQDGGQMQTPYDYTKENGEQQTLSPYAYTMFEGTEDEKAYVEADMDSYFNPKGEYYEANRRGESAAEHLERMRPIYDSIKNSEGGLENLRIKMQSTPLIQKIQEEYNEKAQAEKDTLAFAQKHGIETSVAQNILEEFKNGGKKQLPKLAEGDIFTVVTRDGNGTDYDINSKEYKDFYEGLTKQEKENLAITNGTPLPVPGGEVEVEGEFTYSIPVIKGISSKNDLGLYGKTTMESFQEAKEANPWYDWEGFDPTDPEDVRAYQETINANRPAGNPKIGEDGHWGPQTDGFRRINNSSVNTEPNPDPEPGTEEEEDDKKPPKVQLGPDQSVLPPSSVTSQLALDRDYDRVDPRLISPEPIIQENQRATQQAYNAIDSQGLTGAARAAAIAEVANNKQAANANAIFQANMQNAQILNRAQAQNAQIQMAEENAEAQDALNYEQRVQTGQAIAEENWRNYYDYGRKLNTARFNDIRRQNTVNQLFENYTINADGTISYTGVDDDYIKNRANTLLNNPVINTTKQ